MPKLLQGTVLAGLYSGASYGGAIIATQPEVIRGGNPAREESCTEYMGGQGQPGRTFGLISPFLL